MDGSPCCCMFCWCCCCTYSMGATGCYYVRWGWSRWFGGCASTVSAMAGGIVYCRSICCGLGMKTVVHIATDSFCWSCMVCISGWRKSGIGNLERAYWCLVGRVVEWQGSWYACKGSICYFERCLAVTCQMVYWGRMCLVLCCIRVM